MAKDRKDDLFRRSFEAGTAFLDMTRERAEALVKDFVKAGEVSKGKAQKLVDEVLEKSRKGTEELREVIRRELAEQVSALGLATKEDIARLEGRLDEMGTMAGSAGAGPASTPTSTKAAPLRKSTPRKGSGTGTPPMAPAAPAAPAAATKKAATKARTPRKAGGAPPGPASRAEGEVSGTPGATPSGGPPANGPAPG